MTGTASDSRGDSIEIFSTTADVGLRIRATAIERLYFQAVEGFNRMVFEGLDLPTPGDGEGDPVRFRHLGDSCENVLVNLLSELVFYLNSRGEYAADMQIVSAGPMFLEAVLLFVPARVPPILEIKSVTYHNLKVTRKGGMFQTEIIFDI